jgi:hypothetical protein
VLRARALKEEQLKCTTARAEALARGEDPDELLPQSEKEIEQGKSPRLKYPLKPSGKAVKGGIALTWRLMRQADGRWAVSFTTDVAGAPLVTGPSTRSC